MKTVLNFTITFLVENVVFSTKKLGVGRGDGTEDTLFWTALIGVLGLESERK